MLFGQNSLISQHGRRSFGQAHGDSDQAVFDFLASLRRVGTQEAREELMKLVGVGRKVADCVLLMSLDKVCIHIQLFLFCFRMCFLLIGCTNRGKWYLWTLTSTKSL